MTTTRKGIYAIIAVYGLEDSGARIAAYTQYGKDVAAATILGTPKPPAVDWWDFTSSRTGLFHGREITMEWDSHCDPPKKICLNGWKTWELSETVTYGAFRLSVKIHARMEWDLYNETCKRHGTAASPSSRISASSASR